MANKNHQRGAQAPLFDSEIILSVEKLAIGGAGIARHDGLVVFVPRAAPHEEVLARITQKKKNFLEAEIIEVLKPGPSRRKAPCPVAETCGGCNWQHLDELTQQRQKENLVYETLKKFNPQMDFEYLPLVKSPRSFRYRNRIQPKYQSGRFGFFARNSHEIVPIEDCLIAEEPLAQKFSEAKQWVESNKRGGGVQRLEMYISESETVHYGLIDDEDAGIGFSQVNRFQNEDLLKTVLRWSQGTAYDAIYDLYAGAGNFSFPLAQAHLNSKVVGVELNPKLVQRARKRIQGSQIEYYASDVDSFLRRARINRGDLIVLDPPRTGCSEETMKRLALSQAKKIIYISCHPVSLARDLKWFFAAAAKAKIPWQTTRVQAFEMFPQTDHVETIAELRVDS